MKYFIVNFQWVMDVARGKVGGVCIKAPQCQDARRRIKERHGTTKAPCRTKALQPGSYYLETASL